MEPPSWQQGTGANEWWVELTISGSIAAAHLEVLGQGDVPLTYRWNKWVGATSFRVAAGTRVIAHAEDRAGQHARTRSFSYLVETRPLTDECAAGCRQSCRGYLLRELATLGGLVTRVHDLNDDLDAVGEADTTSRHRRAVLFRGNTIRDLGTLGGPNSVAYGINAHGQVVGAAQTPSSNWHAFVWEERGPGTAVMIDLGRLGGMAGRGVAINDNGDVAGNTENAGGSGKMYSSAALWSQGITTPLERPPYVWTADAVSIDDHGIVVGRTASLYGNSQAVAWYARTATVLSPLAGLPAGAAYRGDWRLEVARAINHDGVIAGWGAHERETRSFLLIPASTPRLGAAEDPSAE